MLVHFWQTRETADDTRAPVVGLLRCRPIRSRVIAGTPDEEVLPDPFSVALDDDGKADVPLAETSAANPAWEVSLYVEGGSGWGPVYVTVPAGVECDWPDLVRVDPATLDPAAAPEAAWWAAIEGITDDIGAAVADYLVTNPPAVGGLDSLTDVDTTGQAVGDVLKLAAGGWAPGSLSAAEVGADAAGTAAALIGGLVIPDSPDDIGAAPAIHSHAYAATSHTHAPADITGTAVVTTDARLSDDRTPKAHAASHKTGGTDALTPADIGAQPAGSYAAASHTQAASTISDSTAVGRSVLTAADVAAARTAIGAGTSSLVLGTTAGTAKAGDYAPDLSGYVPTSRTVNGKALTGDITLSASDVGASTFSGAYADLSGKPTLGTAADNAETDFATAAQGSKADETYAGTQPANAQTGTTYTLQASDAGKLVTLTSAAAITLTIPGNVFTVPAGKVVRVDCLVAGSGMVTAVGSSCTVNGTPSLVSRAQYSAFSVLFTSATTAVVIGDLA